MSQTATKTNADAFHLSDEGQWDHYNKNRPRYPDSMFRRWLTYHGTDEPLEKVHDLGTGGGTGALAFLDALPRIRGSNPIKTYYLSDPGENNINAARRNLTSERFPGTKFIFHHGPGEEPNPNIAPGSLDFVMACECLHWTDIEPTMRNMAASLRPGGTFASVLYESVPRITSDAAARRAQVEVDRAWRAGGAKSGWRPHLSKRLQAAMGLDFVPLEADLWREGSVVRWYCNVTDREWSTREMIADLSAEQFEANRPPRRARFEKDGGTEKEEVTTDLVDWGRQGLTVKDLRDLYHARMPGLYDELFETDVWAKLVRAVEAAGGTVDGHIPAMMVLAKRK